MDPAERVFSQLPVRGRWSDMPDLPGLLKKLGLTISVAQAMPELQKISGDTKSLKGTESPSTVLFPCTFTCTGPYSVHDQGAVHTRTMDSVLALFP